MYYYLLYIYYYACVNGVYTGVVGNSPDATFFMSTDGGLNWKAVSVSLAF